MSIKDIGERVEITESEFEASDSEARMNEACDIIAIMLYEKYIKESSGGSERKPVAFNDSLMYSGSKM